MKGYDRMPFTLSHAAAVLPLVRNDGAGNGTGRGPLLASALVAGSFAPDVPYYTESVAPGTFRFGHVTHGAPGIVTVDVLIAAVLVAAWLLVREPLVALLPQRRRGRAAAFLRGQPWRGVPVAALLGRFWLSAAAGALTHVGWDAFTHPGRAGVRLLPVLDREVAPGLPLYFVVQYGSSAVALAFIVWWTRRSLARLPAAPCPPEVPRLSAAGRRWSYACLGAVTVTATVCRCWGTRSLSALVPTAMFGAGAGVAGGLVLYAVAARVLVSFSGDSFSGGSGTAPPAGTSGGSARRPWRR